MPSNRGFSLPFDPALADDWRDTFREWLPTHTAGLLVQLAHRTFGDHVIDAPSLSWCRDAWIAHRFADATNQSEMRLCREEFPDFEVRKAGVSRLCEATEALRPGRRRGAEFKAARLVPMGINHVEQEDFLKLSSAISAVESAIARKVAKKYPRRFELVVYVNLGFVEERSQFDEWLLEKTRLAPPGFSGLTFV